MQGLLRTRLKTTRMTFCSRSRRPTPVVPSDCRLLPALRPTVLEGPRGQFSHSAPTHKAWSRGDDAMTPKQVCPRPQGLGHNLRSKTQWFTRFCNSHQVSHFTTFFIDARAEISIAESRLIDSEESLMHWAPLRKPRGPPLPSSLFLSVDRTKLRSIAHRRDVVLEGGFRQFLREPYKPPDSPVQHLFRERGSPVAVCGGDICWQLRDWRSVVRRTVEQTGTVYQRSVEGDPALVARTENGIRMTGPTLPPVARQPAAGETSRAWRAKAPVVNQVQNKPGKRWSDLFKDNRHCDGDMALSTVTSQGNRAMLSAADMEPIERAMGHCLIGRFIGRFPGWLALKELTRRWRAPHKLFHHHTLWLVFKFDTKEDADRVLQGGPYVIHGCPLYMKLIPPCFSFQTELQTQVPLWMQIFGLPLDCWTPSGLSKVASMVGHPLYTDRVTKAKDRISFARVLVEIDDTKPPQKSHYQQDCPLLKQNAPRVADIGINRSGRVQERQSEEVHNTILLTANEQRRREDDGYEEGEFVVSGKENATHIGTSENHEPATWSSEPVQRTSDLAQRSPELAQRTGML
ncbi:hypothetical protein ZIOFF_038251 [Zingiber officinale]|uniref:DUF4283 domain-containing protein n=1 Tax=Zingiber officinale TaxID=94328 RepID=A0A8J5G2B6_ZINOF|nr:hypothetical protein ZIOFF_038251 [Zingiber officinale]